MVAHFATQVEKGTDEITAEWASQRFPTPYWDPVLRRSPRKVDTLLRGLFDRGVVSFRSALKADVGVFFVKKKDPAKIRMIVDCRRANACHRAPPSTRLSSAFALGDLDLSDRTLHSSGFGSLCPIKITGSAADVNDCFYQFCLPEASSWFGVRRLVDAYSWGARRIYDDDLREFRRVVPGEMLYPVFEAVPMGWAFALHFCHEAVARIASDAVSASCCGLLRERSVAPSLSPGSAALGVYVDNVFSIGAGAGDSEAVLNLFAAACDREDVAIHTEAVGEESLELLGLRLDGRGRRLSHVPRRLWRLHLSGWALLRRRQVHPVELEVWIGHFVHIASLRRPLLSVLQVCYAWLREDPCGVVDAGMGINFTNRRFAIGRGRPRALSEAVRSEIYVAMHLAFLSESELGLPFCDLVGVSDSSSYGYALLTTNGSHEEQQRECQFRERWRFRDVVVPPARAGLTAASLGLPGLSDLALPEELVADDAVVAGRASGVGCSTAFAAYLADQAPRSQARLHQRSRRHGQDSGSFCVEIPCSAPPIHQCWDPPGRWRTVLEGVWKYEDEHINLKEGRASLIFLRRCCRSVRHHWKRLLQFSDNLSSLFAFDKGRSKSRPLNTLCRRACAYQLSCGLFWHLRHVPTDRNWADAGSRRRELPTARPGAMEPSPEKLKEPSNMLDRGDGGPGPCFARDTMGQPVQARMLARSLTWHSECCFLELFCGQAGLTQSMSERGMRVMIGFELGRGARFDLSRRATQQLVLRLIRSKKVWYVHIGVPCSVWSIARRGVKNLHKAGVKETLGVEFALFAAEVVRECHRCSLSYSLENPSTSKIWSFEPIARLAALPGACHVDLHLCRYGFDHRKPIRLLTNLMSLKALSLRCNHSFRHFALQGSATTKSGAYPLQLCNRWSSLVAADCPDAGFGSAASWEHEWSEALEKLVRRREERISSPDISSASGLPGRALKYLRSNDVVFGGSVGNIAAGSHEHLNPGHRGRNLGDKAERPPRASDLAQPGGSAEDR